MTGYPDGPSAQSFQRADAELRRRLGWRGEFRWSKLSQRSRDLYFASLANEIPAHHAVIWAKPNPGQTGSRSIPTEIDMMRRAMARLGGPTPASRLIVDGVRHRDRATEIRRALGVAEVRFEPSHTNPHLQMADMLAGFHAWDQAQRINDITPEFRGLRKHRSSWD